MDRRVRQARATEDLAALRPGLGRGHPRYMVASAAMSRASLEPGMSARASLTIREARHDHHLFRCDPAALFASRRLRIANQYERAVIFRFGKYARTSGPGL